MTASRSTRNLLAWLTAALLVPFATACGNTVEGVEEDTQDNVDQADEELNEEGDY